MWDGDLTGEVVDGRYALGNLYGSGGMAEVYRALDTKLDRRVAIKLFQGSATHEDQVRLDREAQVLAGLRCPGVVTVYDTGSFRGRPFYVMQPVDGGTLRRRMREPLAPEVVARIGTQVAEILVHVHRHGVVHRDVKPSNILLEPGERRAYLADFGLALQAQVTRVTRSGMLVGTAGYLAPEQVRGGEVGPAADIYALGLVLLECLTGRPEYPGGDTEAALARLHREPRIPANLPGPWGDVLTAMTESLPTRRPTAQECARLLADAELASVGAAPLTAVEVVERPAAPPVPPVPSRRKPVLLLSAVVGGVGVLAMLAAVSLSDDAAPQDLRQQLDAPAATAEGTSVPSASTVTVVEQLPAETVVVSAAQPVGEQPVDGQPVDGQPAVTTTEAAQPPPTTKSKKNGPPRNGEHGGKDQDDEG
ncbi:serine/threonine-protein kinase [Actinosynnema sp. CS-041913]|uniref:serine/threonine-protein kinase n=1 Tax=Actinosynnema sp. CS-041913 TaxID=3239917 RepID=UPI003D93EEB2